MKNWQVKNMVDAFLVPHNFMIDGSKFTLRRGVDSEGDPNDTLELDINGIYFKKQPYLDINFGENNFILSVLTCHF